MPRNRPRAVLGRAALGGVFLAASLAGCAALRGGPCEDGESRAGNPSAVCAYAQPSDTGNYTGYAVGGGSACGGDAPGPDEGTWGWDYTGLCLPSKIILGWFHGLRDQGGAGSYATDGPPLSLHKKDE